MLLKDAEIWTQLIQCMGTRHYSLLSPTFMSKYRLQSGTPMQFEIKLQLNHSCDCKLDLNAGSTRCGGETHTVSWVLIRVSHLCVDSRHEQNSCLDFKYKLKTVFLLHLLCDVSRGIT